ncbi:hypothetical protein ACVWYH_005679 [Bradyrhizobium sp. GM24.11]
MMLEADALQIVAGTLPFAMAVKAIEDWTVDGRAQRNKTPAESVGVTSGDRIGLNARPNSGNSTNVVSSTSACQ